MKVQMPKELIYREAYIDRIKPFIRKPVIKVLTGHWRMGKSYLCEKHESPC
ncbi:MAG: hypothetical protein LBS55_14095 [Prevotellaceae bacterium]|jgi:hypothetical protein|nr:hypothetical protein [Prevotellaceae bacterium]